MKEWYLIKRPDYTSGGFEDENFDAFSEDAFSDALDTRLAEKVWLYNSDLTAVKKVKCIVQGKLADTQSNSMDRTVLFPIGTVKAGMYIYHNNAYWLLTGFPDNNRFYEKITASICQYNIRWQNKKGEIIKRWANFTSASKYDIGVYANSALENPSNNFILLMPCDNETLELDGKRIFIDVNFKNPTKVFRITRNDDVLNYFGMHGGILSFIVDRTELNKDTDRIDIMICDYFDLDKNTMPSPPRLDNVTGKIADTSAFIILNRAKKLEAVFTDDKGNKLSDITPEWEIVSDFSDDIKTEYSENIITIAVEDEKYIGEKVTVNLKLDGLFYGSFKLEVTDI